MKSNKSKPVLPVGERAYVEYEHCSPFLTNEFLQLRTEWDERLKESGFHDLEVRRKQGGDFTEVRLNSNRIRDEAAARSAHVVESYYRAAGIFLHETTFGSELEKTVFELWCDGRTYREIAEITGKGLATTHRIVHQWRTRLNKAIKEKHPMFEEVS